jgi:hypothetical protein
MPHRALRTGLLYSLLMSAAWGFLAAVVAADPTGATEVVQQAAREGGWVAAALCFIVLCMVTGLVVLIRNLMERQNKTEDYLRNELSRLIMHMSEVCDDNTLERARLRSVFSKRKCLADSDVAVVMGDQEGDDSSLGETGKRVMERRKEREQRKAT